MSFAATMVDFRFVGLSDCSRPVTMCRRLTFFAGS
jgi:hypothetical protein